MHILVVCNKPPYPTVDGGCVAMASTLELLHTMGHRITCVVISTQKHPFRAKPIPQSLLKVQWKPVFLDTRIKPLAAIRHLHAGKSYILHRFIHTDVSKELENLLQKESFDLAHLESLFALPYAAMIKKKGIPVVYRAHNIEHLIWVRTAIHTANPVKKWYLNKEARLLEKEEIALIEPCDAVMSITPQDAQWMAKQFPDKLCTSIPIPISVADMSTSAPSPIVYHLGAMDWQPNQEAIRWLLEDIWPRVVREIPNAQLHIAGKAMPDWLRNQSVKGVTIEGFVKQITPYLKDKGILAVPLLSGSGLRIKILEAMANGKAVITTRQGLEGIPAVHGKEVWIADEATTFATGLITLIKDEQLRASLADNGRRLVLTQYSPSAVKEAITSLYLTTGKA